MSPLWPFLITIFLSISCGRSAPASADNADTVPRASIATDRTPASSGELSNADVQQVAAWLRDTLLKADLDFLTPEERYFSLAKFDLNDDGADEFFVGFMNDYFCGSGGCTYYIVNTEGMVKARFTVSYAPFEILATKTKGWHDLLIDSSLGTHKLQYDGQTYPSNPSTLPIIQQDTIQQDHRLTTVLDGGQTEYRF